jgi:FAD/FMN-containing dehydrogenase
MVAYDSRRVPDPSYVLCPETIDALRAALRVQRQAGVEPVDELRVAIRTAGTEARERLLPAEALLIQLKRLADEAGVQLPDPQEHSRTHVREWMVRALLRAYWDLPPGTD